MTKFDLKCIFWVLIVIGHLDGYVFVGAEIQSWDLISYGSDREVSFPYYTFRSKALRPAHWIVNLVYHMFVCCSDMLDLYLGI